MKRKLLIVLFMGLAICSFAETFISPIGFVDNEINRQKVISYIEWKTKNTYAAIGMDDPVTLRMMENENLNAFKELIKITDTALLQQVINTYSAIGMNDYSTILMMYNEQKKASSQTLQW